MEGSSFASSAWRVRSAESNGRPRRNFSRGRWAAVGAAVAATLGSGGIGFVRAIDEVESMVTPIAPCRLIDTRPADPKGPLRRPVGPAEALTFDVFESNGDCAIPSGVTAIDVNLTGGRRHSGIHVHHHVPGRGSSTRRVAAEPFEQHPGRSKQHIDHVVGGWPVRALQQPRSSQHHHRRVGVLHTRLEQRRHRFGRL